MLQPTDEAYDQYNGKSDDLKGYDSEPLNRNGRFYARDVKVVKTNLTYETLKPSGIKTRRKNEDDLTEENEIFL